MIIYLFDHLRVSKIKGDTFKVMEYKIYAFGGYICSQYEDKEQVAYTENVYSTSTLELMGSTEFKIKDICY